MRSLRITVPASRDLDEISEYFLESSIDACDRFVQIFKQKCQHLARFPYIGKSYALTLDLGYFAIRALTCSAW